MAQITRDVVRALLKEERKEVKRCVLEVIKAASDRGEYSRFVAFLKEHGIEIVE